ncbi:MAG: radical SAM family heme chaperone HemW [Chloroflexi bacterium]|nr:radical SAM family heme chaperone HemW [Chloroflexota bacterium]
MRPPEALYIHVPFCVSLCPYCDFVVVAGAATRGPRNRVTAFLAALRRELDLRADLADARWGTPGSLSRPPLGSLYFGGGTPSLLPGDEIAGIVEIVRLRFGLASGAEVTVESNPGPDERGDARALADAGVTRISFGAQALDDDTLRSLGRRHRARDVREAITDAREAGIASVSLDLLYDTPGGTLQAWVGTLDSALSLAPDHLSLYALTLDDPDAEGLTGPTGDHLPVARGARRWRADARARQDDDRAAAMYEHAVHRLAEAGFHGYEISNWALPGHESRHNLAYWERRPYEAVGPGAHAFDGAARRWNAARLDSYIAALTSPPGVSAQLPPGGTEAINPEASAAERIILGLRTSHGVSLSESTRQPLSDHFSWARDADLLSVTADDRIVLTTKGRLLSNELFSRLV